MSDDDDNVVRLNDFRKPPTAQAPTLRVVSRNQERSLAEVVRSLAGNDGDDVNDQKIIRIALCMDFADRLGGYQLDKNEVKIREQEKVIEGYTLDQIYGFMACATDNNLLTKPHFYTALLRVAQRRTRFDDLFEDK